MNDCTAFNAAINDVALGAPMSDALAAHLPACATCANQLDRQRVLLQRIDRAVAAHVDAEPPLIRSERIAARAASKHAQRRHIKRLAMPAVAALAAVILVLVWPRGAFHLRTPAPSVAALDAWRSPTASLLIAHGNVLATPFIPSRSKI